MEGYPLRIECNECIKKTGHPVIDVKGEHIMRIAVTYENETVFHTLVKLHSLNYMILKTMKSKNHRL